MSTTMTSTTELTSHFTAVLGSQMHYYDAGKGDPILFLHGMPTAAYVWRHVLPLLSSQARCIAPDLIGMGESDKPAIAYRVFDHIAYIEAFIDVLQLKNITLVVHGWGSVIGLDYARRHESNIKALVFYESHLRPVKQWGQLSLPVQQLASLLKRPGAGFHAVVKKNYFIEKLLPSTSVDALSEEDLAYYRAAFSTPESRQLLWQYLQELPLGDGPEDVVALIQLYSDWLQRTALPKLLLYAVPGFITVMDTVQWAKNSLPNLKLVDLDNALHLAQVSMPTQFSEVISTWYQALDQKNSS